MKFEVKRSEWYRGWPLDSALFVEEANRIKDEPDKKRCCLGFFANACGLYDDQICDRQLPRDVPENVSTNFASQDWNNLKSMLIADMINVNDDESLSDEDREEELIVLFSRVGHEIVFVD